MLTENAAAGVANAHGGFFHNSSGRARFTRRIDTGGTRGLRRLLRTAETNPLTVQTVLGRAGIATADHSLACAQLASRNEPHGAAAGARHDGNIRVMGVAKFGLVLEDENRSRVHFFGNPFFQKLQVG